VKAGPASAGYVAPGGEPALVDGSLAIFADLYKYWHVDYQNRSIRIVCQDGQVLAV
jgi:hypothetical protein